MRFIASTLWSNELLIYDDEIGGVVKGRKVVTRNEYDRLHSVRRTPLGWLTSSTYGVQVLPLSLRGPQRYCSHPRLSNVHSCDWLGDGQVVVANTGLDELLFCRLADELEVERIFDVSAWVGKPKKLGPRDRRDEPRVRAEDDNTHVNCASPAVVDGRRVVMCCLFHDNVVLAIDVESLDVTRVFEDMGLRIHSALVADGSLWICSSAESQLRRYDLDTGALLWSWTAPGQGWTRSLVPLKDGTAVFASERDRDNPESQGYVARIELSTCSLLWVHDMPEEGPFDVIPVDISKKEP